VVAALIALALAVPAPTHDTLPVYVDTGSGYEVVLWSTTSGPEPRLQLGAFRRPRAIWDLLPEPLQEEAHLMALSWLGLEPQRSRLLLVRGTVRIYGIPTASREVCAFVLEPHSLNCPARPMHGATPKVEPRVAVWGIVSDRASRVDVRFHTRTAHAVVGNNAFYLRMPRGEVAPRSIVVTDSDGARHVYTIERCHVADFDQLVLPSGPLDPPPGC
jgi:hypothetical protein